MAGLTAARARVKEIAERYGVSRATLYKRLSSQSLDSTSFF
ncbi:MAG: helix-turn-helix domain-containing protein [Rhodoferax sp.]|nr:helix-turn-helix domain-containing protein [Rhodoferax sp.]